MGSFIEHLKMYLDNVTWLPESFKKVAGLLLLSAIADRKVSVRISVREHYPNLYVLLVGESGCGKGVVIDNIVYRMLEEIDEKLLLPKEFTKEALAKNLSKNRVGIICNDELDALISSKKYMAGISSLLNSLYSCPDKYDIELVKGKRTVINPYLCLALGVQPGTLSAMVDEKLITTGFLQRFLILHGKEQPVKHGKDWFNWFKAMYRLEALKNFLENSPGIVLSFTDKALEMLFQYVKGLKDRYPDVAEMFGRTTDILIKLSILWWLDELTRDIISVCNVYKNKRIKIINKVINVNTVLTVDSVDNVGIVNNVNNVGNVYNNEISNKKLKNSNFFSSFSNFSETPPFFYRGSRQLTVPPQIDERVVKMAIGYYEGTLPERLTIYQIANKSIEVRNLERVRQAIFKLIESSKTVNMNNRQFIHRRDIMRMTGIKLSKLTEYMSILQEEGVIGNLKIAGRKKMYEFIGEQ